MAITHTHVMDINSLINTAPVAAPRRLLPWRVVFPDGTTVALLALGLSEALLTANELMPGFARIERTGDW